MIELVSASLDQTVDLGRRLGQLAEPGDVFALDGELGAGKTQLVRGLALGMNLDPTHVSSPTFVIMHEYQSVPDSAAEDTGRVLVHIDAYRLTGPDDLASVGFDDELRAGAVVAVEWSERIESFPGGAAQLGENRLHILIQHHGGGSRRLTLTPHGRWAERLSALSSTMNPQP
ncbi:MAG: tRNA (adenosine(37)-N6)-threonylcarbamoyltransferase complex ATPase subunit type 1 TsaE [Planctomycetota bacterium]